MEFTRKELKLIRAALHTAKHKWTDDAKTGPPFWKTQAEDAEALEEKIEEGLMHEQN